MSIFKETFKNEIKDQIKTRQEALVARTPASIQYYNSRNAWIRMTSSVDVGNDKGALAKSYILLGGVLYDKQQPLKSGIGATNKEAYSTVTPSGNEQHRLGIRPMPGITSIDIKSKSAYGSLREVTVNFQCWDIKQLEELELLYMRPGYSVLVEWGWIPYLDNKGNLQPKAQFMNAVLDGGHSKEAIWKGIQKISTDTNGNYEGHYGFIKNYSWSARPDGGYDCTTSVISMGEILESLKINYGVTNTEIPTKGIFNDKRISFGKDEVVTKAYSENIVAGICAELHEIGMKEKGFNIPFTVTAPKSSYSNDIKEYKLYKAKINIKGGEANADSKKSLAENEFQIYISLKDFIDILNKVIIIKGGIKPICELSLNYGDHNGGLNEPIICLGDTYQLSVDPTVCLIKNEAWLDPKNLELQNVISASDIEIIKNILIKIPNSYWRNEKTWQDDQIAVIGNIYVNIAYIYSLVTNPNVEAQDKKEKNDIALYDLLKNIMFGLNRSIGNVANFDIHLDTVDNITRIIDLSYTGNREEDLKKIEEVPIQVQNTKSIVRTYKLESQIFPEQSAVVAIGAQAQGGALASDTNTLVDFNQNLIDRIVPKKDVSDIINPAVTPEQINKQAQNNKDNLGNIISYISVIKPPSLLDSFFGGEGFDANDAGKYSNALKDIINYKKSQIPSNNKNRAIIPTKLSLTVDGIGGMIIGNLFTINEDIIPRGYKRGKDGVGARIAYVVTGLNHSVQNNDWTTTIDAQFINMDEPGGIISMEQYRKILAYPSIVQSGALNRPTVAPNPASTPAFEALKIAGNSVFNANGEVTGYCARYVYSIAYHYNNILKGITPNGALFAAGGNANQASYRSNLKALGYQEISLGTMSRQQLSDYITGGQWGAGDIINYQTLDSTAGGGYKYGHTQIYTGGVLNGSSRVAWASSLANNYGTGLVYKNQGPYVVYAFKKITSLGPINPF